MRTACSLLLIVSSLAGLSGARGLYGRSYAVVVGINAYNQAPWQKLNRARQDAQGVADYLGTQGFEVVCLLDKKATRQAIIDAVYETVIPKIRRDDRFLFFFAGHGESRAVGGKDLGYLVPYDGSRSTSTLISHNDVYGMSEAMAGVKHQLFVIDACYGGLIIEVRGLPFDPRVPNYLMEVTSRVARQVMTAGGRDQQVVDEGPEGHSVFTGHFLKGLRDGLADAHRDGYITFSELSTYMLPATHNRYQTLGVGFLPGHQQGEFVFKSPQAVTGDTTLRPYKPGETSTTRGANESKEVVLRSYAVQESGQDDDPAHATRIPPNTVVDTSVGDKTDRGDWYRLDFNEPGTLRVRLENTTAGGQTGILGPHTVYDEKQRRTYRGSVHGLRPGQSSESPPISVRPQAPCFLEVTGKRGSETTDYRIESRFHALPWTDTVESNNTREDAQFIPPNCGLTALIGYDNDPEDWYCIEIEENGWLRLMIDNLHQEGCEAGILGSMTITDDHQNPLEQFARHGIRPAQREGSRLVAVSAGNRYYVRVAPKAKQASAPYRFNSSFTPLQTQDAREPNGNRGKAQEIKPDEGLIATVGFKGDREDWYRMQLPADGTLRLSIANTHPTGIVNGKLKPVFILDRRRKEMGRVGSHGIQPTGIIESSPISLSGKATYYVRIGAVPSHAVPYHLETTFAALDYTDDCEPNNKQKQAAELVDFVEATVGYGKDAEDWYAVSFESEGVLNIHVANLHAPEVKQGSLAPMRLCDKNGKRIAPIASHGVNPGQEIPSRPIDIVAGVHYYLQVLPKKDHSAPYSIDCVFSPK